MRRWAIVNISALLGAMMLLASCGQPGSPQPPSLQLPRAVEDLTASRKGDRVTLRWTPPIRFTDNRMIRKVGATQICRVAGSAPAATCAVVGSTPPPPDTPKGKQPQRIPGEYVDVLPPSVLQHSSPTGSVMYGVEILNTHSHSVGMSSQVSISIAPSFPPPSRLKAEVGDEGITLTWGPIAVPAIPEIQFVYQISRKGETGDFTPIATLPIDQWKYVDQTFEWEKKFEYRIAVLTQSPADKKTLVEGDDSEAVSVFAHDIYPPAQPRDLQAVFSGPGQKPFIDLTWAPNLEPDLAGYNVYRHEEGSQAVKLNTKLVTAPSFRDDHVESGKKYFYSVSAIDVRGNESTRSGETGEGVP